MAISQFNTEAHIAGIILAWILSAPMAHLKKLCAPLLKTAPNVIICNKLLWKTLLF